MIRKKLTATMAVCMAVVTLFSTTAFAYYEDGENAADNSVIETETEASGIEMEWSDDNEKEPSDIDSGFQTVLDGLLSNVDPEILEVITEHPKLVGMFLPTLHVTLRQNSMTVSVGTENDQDESYQEGTVITAGENLNVRTDAGIENDIITQLRNGESVTVLGEKDGWYEIEIPVINGYVCGDYLMVNDIPSEEMEDGYSFDIDASMMMDLLEQIYAEKPNEASSVPVHGLTPDGNLSLVDDLGERNGSGQQFVTLVTNNGNYFYLIIDRDEKGQETVHFLNMVDEQDLFSLMDDDAADALRKQQAETLESKEAEEKASSETAGQSNESDTDNDNSEKKKTNAASVLIVLALMAAVGGGWFVMQTKKKKQSSSAEDPDADYIDEEDDYAYESPEADDRDPYEDEILEDPDETEDSMEDE